MAKRSKRKNRIPRDVAEIVAERASGFCEIMNRESGCNGRAEHMHHRQLRSQGGEHTVSNLVHICAACHYWIHNNTGASYDVGWLVRSTREPESMPFFRRGGAVILMPDGEMEKAA